MPVLDIQASLMRFIDRLLRAPLQAVFLCVALIYNPKPAPTIFIQEVTSSVLTFLPNFIDNIGQMSEKGRK